jgi:cellulose synthase/poly-beta-1,6-N-acetylglucosamine synthase-like glycosyltransferase
MKTESYLIRKSPLMISACILIWLVLILRYDGLLAPLFSTVHSAGAKALVALVILWINLVWFYGVFHLGNVLFSFLSQPIPTRLPSSSEKFDGVAILYTTRNDFCHEAAESCIKQDYPNFTVYILDDSTCPKEQAKIEAFCREHAECCTLVRRKNKSGFKAGNLNHGLRTVAGECKYFAVVDADEVLPVDFLSRMIPCFSLDEHVGFVQANHRYRNTKTSTFASAMSKDADLHWGLFLPARNKYGFSMFYGHGAVIRTDVWQKVGGFPEIVSEDIAFAAKARELGFYGMFLKDVVAEEAFPNNYQSFLRREVKVVKGTLQFILGPARSFFRSGNVTVTEKADLLASTFVLFLPIVFLVYLIIANVILPVALAYHRTSITPLGTSSLDQLLKNVEPLGTGIRELWSWDFYLLTVLTILAPLVYQVKVFLRSPTRMLRYAARSTAVFLSIVPSVAWEAILYVWKKRVEFLPTGDQTEAKVARTPERGIFSGTFGALLFVSSLLTGNIALLTIALSFILHPILLRIGWNSPGLRVITLVPFIFFVAVFSSIPFLLIGVAGVLAATMPAHH